MTNETYDVEPNLVDRKVVETLEEVEKQAAGQEVPDTYTLKSSGVVVRIKKVSPMLIGNIQRKYKPKEPPALYDENLGRETRNPNHPDYLRYLDDLNEEFSLRAAEVLIGAGVQVIKVPEGVPTLDSDEWMEDLELFLYDEDIPQKGRGRELAWLLYVIFTDLEEMSEVSRLVARKSGISKEEVQNQIEGFRDNKE